MIAACAPAAFAATPASGAHAHEQAAGSPALRLDHGRKWATDAPLRQGMARIRGLVAPQLAAAHGGRLEPADYAALATKIDAEVAAIVKDCRLPPEADGVLHVVLGELLAGTGTLAGRTAGATPVDGLVQVVAAVNTYGRYFEHPGWKPLAEAH
ncbi:hypothetical protein H8N03_20675 [Ramlibacter sp. USB13]|uniref:DnrO protein n=1 Tax=Ramlibacter cellulosilyticus TaxID=2764187 RepID=A0A923MWE6_9BURK|nr:hypothetical protein [Ramlibacter cellulosilyticus]